MHNTYNENNLTLNNSKTFEIIFSRPRSRGAITPPVQSHHPCNHTIVQSHHRPWSLESYVQSRWRCWESPYPAHSLYLNISRRQFPLVLVHCLLSELFERMDWTRPASITCSSQWSSPSYCTHLLLGGVHECLRPWTTWGSLEEKHSIGFLLGRLANIRRPLWKVWQWSVLADSLQSFTCSVRSPADETCMCIHSARMIP